MTMTDATIAADFDQTLDIERHFTAKITFHLQVVLNAFLTAAERFSSIVNASRDQSQELPILFS